MDDTHSFPKAKQTGVETVSRAEERFDRLRRRIGLYLAPTAFGVVFWLTHGKLSSGGNCLSAILGRCFSAVDDRGHPLPVTAMLGACLCILLGVADARVVFAPFADPIIFLFIGGFIIARAMTLHHLDRRFALAILSLRGVGGSRARILGAFGLVTAVVSMWISNSAATAMMMPIALGILRAIQGMNRPGDGQSGISRS